MVSAQKDNTSFPDPFETSQRMAELWVRMSAAIQKSSSKLHEESFSEQNIDPFNIRPAVFKYWEKAMESPENFIDSNIKLFQENMSIWNETWTAFIEGRELPSTLKNNAPSKDRRFKSELWYANPLFSIMKHGYFITAQWILEQIQESEGLDEETRNKLLFFSKQYIDAMSPSNFPFSNPEVLREMIETGGQSLLEGIENLIEDIENNDGNWSLTTTDKSAHEVGKNLATTEGSVVFENEMMQLIQYKPTTKTVFKTPLLILPPWINKYYILDMREDNSYIKWAVDQGHTVFVISWVNPTEEHRNKSFDHYVSEGLFAALGQIEKITGEKQSNVIGYCIGGTMLTCALAYMAAQKDKRVKSATFFTTLVDFEEAGDLKIFIDEEQIEFIEERMRQKGYLDAAYLKSTFSMLRANDLIWSFVINNYLMGKDPYPFDLLYWNDDSVNLPEAMQSFYLRNMYLENNLIKKAGITMFDTPLDITNIKTPSYFLSTREDHIAPWRATYETTKYFTGPCTFTLAASGHIAGVVSPPSNHKYGHWVNDQTPLSQQDWIEGAKEQEGSWWAHWQKWIEEYAGEKVKARPIKKEIEPAPGRYVLGKH